MFLYSISFIKNIINLDVQPSCHNLFGAIVSFWKPLYFQFWCFWTTNMFHISPLWRNWLWLENKTNCLENTLFKYNVPVLSTGSALLFHKPSCCMDDSKKAVTKFTINRAHCSPGNGKDFMAWVILGPCIRKNVQSLENNYFMTMNFHCKKSNDRPKAPAAK